MGALELQKGMALTQRLRRVEVAHPFDAIDYPALPSKPRASALNSVLDRGASVLEVRDRIAVAGVTHLREGMRVRDLGDALGGGQP